MRRPVKLVLTRLAWALALLMAWVAPPLMAQKAKSAPKPVAFKKETFTNSEGMTFVKIPAGSFTMGSADRTFTVVCSDCEGKKTVRKERSHEERVETRCYTCAGRGDVICRSLNGRPHYPDNWPCGSCNATGRARCSDCYGSGVRTSYRTVSDGTYTETCSACSGQGKQTKTDKAADDEKPAHWATISKPFFLGQTEVTQGQWKAVMGTFTDGGWESPSFDDYPRVNVSWEEAQEFCRKLSEKEGKNYRLPTEAEWEYACRAGTSTKYSFGDDEGRLGEYAWFDGNAENPHLKSEGKSRHRVATKKPNPWGLYDMHGNVAEWCEDDWHYSYTGGPTDGQAWVDSPRESYRLLRGGSWHHFGGYCRSAYRGGNDPTDRRHNYGFRVVLALPRTP